MKPLWRSCIISLLVINFFFMTSCDDDDDDKSSQENAKTYALEALENSGVSGTVTFRKQNAQTTLITVQLSGTQAGNSHPAHIHSGAAGSGGPIVLDFNPVDGATGKSETTVTMMNDGTNITYEQLIAFDGHVNVHLSATQLDIMIAQGNVGSNSNGMSSSNGDSDDDGY
jgi:hypothetical protein